MTELDLSALRQQAEEALKVPVGTWTARVENVQVGQSRTTNRPQISVQFVLVDPAGENDGRKVWLNVTLGDNPRAVAAFLGNLERLGVPESVLQQSKISLADLAKHISGKFQIEIAKREWQGNEYPDIRSYKKIGDETGPTFATTPFV